MNKYTPWYSILGTKKWLQWYPQRF